MSDMTEDVNPVLISASDTSISHAVILNDDPLPVDDLNIVASKGLYRQ